MPQRPNIPGLTQPTQQLAQQVHGELDDLGRRTRKTEARQVALATAIDQQAEQIRSLKDIKPFVDRLRELKLDSLAETVEQIARDFHASPAFAAIVKGAVETYLETSDNPLLQRVAAVEEAQGRMEGRITAIGDQVNGATETANRALERVTRLEQAKVPELIGFVVALAITAFISFVLITGWENEQVIWPMKVGIALGIGWVCGMIIALIGNWSLRKIRERREAKRSSQSDTPEAPTEELPPAGSDDPDETTTTQTGAVPANA
jgi:hypothetical protein